MKTMPSTMTGPGPLSEPPLAATPLTVSYGWAVSYSHRIFPSAAAWARMTPVVVPENTTPGIAVMAADWACTQGRPPQSIAGGITFQTSSPVSRFNAESPPAFDPRIGSAVAKYARRSSAAEPHSTPPSALPAPTLRCQTNAPSLSGSIAQAAPDFWPITSTDLPFGSVRSIGELPKSKSGPPTSGQLSRVEGPDGQPTMNASFGVN